MKLPSNKTIVSVAGLILISVTAIITDSPWLIWVGCLCVILLLYILIEKIDN
jgi:hypothetical protein